jgi:drug/metabolite transporter (DMT)-like permease
LKTTLLTTLALLAFAGNSVLCRLALGQGLMDAAGFTSVRLNSGAVMLVLLMLINRKSPQRLITLPDLRTLLGAIWLVLYAWCFSLAYVLLDTGTGALILFGAVQLSLLFSRIIKGHQPQLAEWLGVLLAFSGLVYLLWPALGTPTWPGFLLMAFSGVAWGLYTLLGQGSVQPLRDTSRNFLWAVPLAILMLWWVPDGQQWTTQGVWLAVLSGALTSGVGYAIWYAVLPSLSATQAGVLQLLVPVLAAIGGVLFATEPFGMRLLLSAMAVLGGIALVILAAGRSRS